LFLKQNQDTQACPLLSEVMTNIIILIFVHKLVDSFAAPPTSTPLLAKTWFVKPNYNCNGLVWHNHLLSASVDGQVVYHQWSVLKTLLRSYNRDLQL